MLKSLEAGMIWTQLSWIWKLDWFNWPHYCRVFGWLADYSVICFKPSFYFAPLIQGLHILKDCILILGKFEIPKRYNNLICCIQKLLDVLVVAQRHIAITVPQRWKTLPFVIAYGKNALSKKTNCISSQSHTDDGSISVW